MRLSQEIRSSRQKAERVLNLLENNQEKRRRSRVSEPLEEFIVGVLEEGGTYALAQSTLSSLKREFVDWNEVRVSRPQDIAETIRRTQAPNDKAEALKEILQVLFHESQELTLGQINEKHFTHSEAEQFLRRFPDVSAHAKNRLKLLCMNVDTLPVNGEMLRLVKRLGIVPAHLNHDDVQQALVRIIPTREYFSCYCAFTEHGRTVCLSKRPRCEECVLRKECQTYSNGKTPTTRRTKRKHK